MIQPHASEVLLGAMRRAKQVSFAYRTVDGSETVVLLPLQGFSQAMQRIGVALPSDGHAKADSERPGSTQAAPAKQLLRAPRAISSEAKRSSRSSSAPTAQGSSQLPTALIPRFAALDVAIADLRARTPEDWSRFLPELLPAIQACIERTPGSGVFVTKAWLMSKGLVGVRTRNTTVGWFDCVARREGRHVERFDPVTQTGERLPGEEYIVFTATPESLPEGDCFSREQVVDDANQSIGWLSRYGCAKNATGSRR
ncbi:MAG TPA: hypothetical protein VFB54_07525 [Burkholderiales bacterium]|nr:hypothetical protein [Burkholderiales bacterium]